MSLYTFARQASRIDSSLVIDGDVGNFCYLMHQKIAVAVCGTTNLCDSICAQSRFASIWSTPCEVNKCPTRDNDTL